MRVLKGNLSIIFKNENAKQFSLGFYQDHKWNLIFKEIREKQDCRIPALQSIMWLKPWPYCSE